jgi:hypothetical protein
VVIDSDKPGADDALHAELAALAEQVILLPNLCAIEGALVKGVPGQALREAAEVLGEVYGLIITPDGPSDQQLGEAIAKAIKKPSLHQQYIEALPEGIVPPLAAQILDTLTAAPNNTVITRLPSPQEPT